MSSPKSLDYSQSEFFQYVRIGNYDKMRSFLSENKDLSPIFLNQALNHCFHCIMSANSVHFQIIKELLHKGANLNTQDSYGRTPLMIVCAKGNRELMRFLLDHNVDINVRDENKANALYWAIDNETQYEQFEICESLIRNGSDINIETFQGATPLLKAVEKQQVRVVQLLCECNLSVNVESRFTGDTPLHIAVRTRNRPIIKILMDKFAKTHRKNKKNLNPYDLAKDDLDLLDFMKKLDVKQRNSEQNEINNSLGAHNRPGGDPGKGGNPNKKLTLKNYQFSPPVNKSEKSESNSETLVPFELEIPPQSQQPIFFGKKIQQNPQYPSSFNNQSQDILNHLSPNPCFSPPILNNQMNPLLHNSFSDNSFNQHQNMNNPRFTQKNPKKKYQQKENGNNFGKKSSNFQSNQGNFNQAPYNNNINNKGYGYGQPPGGFDPNNKLYGMNSNTIPNKNQGFQQNFNPNFNPGVYINKPQMSPMPNNFSSNEKEPIGFMNLGKMEEMKTLEMQNDVLRARILELEQELNISNASENNESLENCNDENSKYVQTDLSVGISFNEPQKSYFLESNSLQSKVPLYLPTDVVVVDLHREILEFERIVSKFQTEDQNKFHEFTPILKNYIQEITNIEPEISVYGSCESGLALPYSDIDVAVNLKLNVPTDEMLIQNICENLKRKDAIAEVKKYYNSQHPTQNINQIKIEASFPKDLFDKKVNLTFVDLPKFHGLRYVKLMKHYLKEIKPLRYLSLVIKEFIFQSKLSLLANLSQKSAEIKQSIESPILGELLIEFFYYYGFDVDYVFKEIVVMLPENWPEDKASQQPPSTLIEGTDPLPKLVIGDPLKRHINVGRSAHIMKIKGAFSLAYMVLHQNYKSNSCYTKGEENKKSECCCILERLFTCTQHTGFFRKINQI